MGRPKRRRRSDPIGTPESPSRRYFAGPQPGRLDPIEDADEPEAHLPEHRPIVALLVAPQLGLLLTGVLAQGCVLLAVLREALLRCLGQVVDLFRHAEQALALAEAVGPNCGVCLDIFHMNIEEDDVPAAIRRAFSMKP